MTPEMAAMWAKLKPQRAMVRALTERIRASSMETEAGPPIPDTDPDTGEVEVDPYDPHGAWESSGG